MNSEAYEKAKRDAAAQVEKWFQRDPEYWRKKAEEVIQARLPSNLLNDIQGIPDAKSGTWKMPMFTDEARALQAYYLGLIIVHDSSDAGYVSIAHDLWPVGHLPAVDANGKTLHQESNAKVFLWEAARHLFDESYGDKSNFIKAALQAVGKDLDRVEAEEIKEVEQYLETVSRRLAQIAGGSMSIDERKATYKWLRGEASTNIKAAYDAIMEKYGPNLRNALQKNPALARLHARLSFHLGYETVGTPAKGKSLTRELEKIQAHLDRLEEVRSWIRELITTVNDILAIKNASSPTLRNWRQDLQRWTETDMRGDYHPRDRGKNIALLFGPRDGVNLDMMLERQFDRVCNDLESRTNPTISCLAAKLREKRDAVIEKRTKLIGQPVDLIVCEGVGGLPTRDEYGRIQDTNRETSSRKETEQKPGQTSKKGKAQKLTEMERASDALSAHVNKPENHTDFQPAEIDELHKTAVNLRGFLANAPKWQVLTYETIFARHKKLIACFPNNWSYVKKRLRDNARADLADKLSQRHNDVMKCSRQAVDAAKDTGDVLWPNNLELKIENLIRQIDATIRSLQRKKQLEVDETASFASTDQKANKRGRSGETHTGSEPHPKSLREWADGERVALAIVFTDIVGSTALRNEVGDEQMNEMLEAHFDQGRKQITKCAGREIKTTGDGFLAVFRSTDKALDFAMALHSEPGNERIQIRAGIHIGEVTVQDQDIDGTSVHFTSRVIAAAQGAEIWLSEEAHRAIETLRAKQHSHLQWRRHDGVEIKDFPDSTVWSLVLPGAPIAQS
jgi:class 3 adenylate cyclase